MQISDLPKIDVVSVSHNHYDHLDIDSLRELAVESRDYLFGSKGDEKLLKKKG